MPATLNNESLISRINSLLQEVEGPAVVKQSSELGTSGQASKDPGGYKGPSSHPSARVDSMTQSAPLGARAKENEKDVKEDHPGSGVDQVAAGSGGDQDSKQYNVGTNQSATGEDPSVEDKYKGTKEDPGTTHPANAEDVGEKYSSMRFNDLLKVASDGMNGILADITNGVHLNYYRDVFAKQAAAPQLAPDGIQIDDAALAAEAGYNLADATIKQAWAEKQAASSMVVAQICADAVHEADLVGEYLTKFAQYRQAASQPPISIPTRPKTAADPTDVAPPADAGGGGGDAGGDAAAAAALGGGGGGAGGGGEHEAALNELFSALAQLGISPEELMEAAQAGGGGGGGGEGGGLPIGGGGGGMPMTGGDAGAAAMMPGPAKAASQRVQYLRHNIVQHGREVMNDFAKSAWHVVNHQKRGRARIIPVQAGTKEAQQRQELIGYIREVCGLR
jgi:hypothetical protein